MSNENKRALAISLGQPNRWDITSILTVSPCYLKMEKDGPSPTSYSDEKWGSGPDNFYLNSLNLTFRGYVDFREEKLKEVEPVGFWNLQYSDMHSVDLMSAEKMVKTLTSFRNKMAKINDEHGHPTDFVTSIKRIISATKSETILIERALAKRIGYADHATDSQLWVSRHVSNDGALRAIQMLPISEAKERATKPEYVLNM